MGMSSATWLPDGRVQLGGGAGLRLGVRRGGGPDPKGTRSLTEEKFVELLRREEIAVVCDMRSGRGAETCGRKLKNPSRWEPCGISPPKFMCQCSIAAACKW